MPVFFIHYRSSANISTNANIFDIGISTNVTIIVDNGNIGVGDANIGGGIIDVTTNICDIGAIIGLSTR